MGNVDAIYMNVKRAQMKLTSEEIEACKTPKGGFTKSQLAQWGVIWPPKRGWKQALIDGNDPNNPPDEDSPDHLGNLPPSPIRPNVSAHDLLRQVVIAIIERGHASDLYKFPDVLEYFGAQMPD